MKKTIAALIIIGLGSCSDPTANKYTPAEEYVVAAKEYCRFKPGICVFAYTKNVIGGCQQTEDTCNKYELGDKIKH